MGVRRSGRARSSDGVFDRGVPRFGPAGGGAVQETFIRAFQPRARDAYDGFRPFRPYLLRIARNLLVDRARKAGRLQFGEAIDVDAIDEDAPDLDETILSKQLRDAARQFIDSLDPPTRAFVVARFEEGRAQEDVAAALGITRRRVRTLEGRLRKQLAAQLSAAGLAAEIEFAGKGGQDRPAVTPRT